MLTERQMVAELMTLKVEEKDNKYYVNNSVVTVEIIAFLLTQRNNKIVVRTEELPTLETYIKTAINSTKKQKEHAIIIASESESKIKMVGKIVGEFYPHQLRHKSHNAQDEKFLTPFFWARDPGGDSHSVFVQSQHNKCEFTKLMLTDSSTKNELILRTALATIEYDSSISMANRYMTLWETMLLSASSKIRQQFAGMNSDNKETRSTTEDNIFKIITDELPAVALNNMISVSYAIQTSESGATHHTDIMIGRRGQSPKQVTVFEYLALLISILPTITGKEIKWPAIYSSDMNENALSHFDLQGTLVECKNEDNIPAWKEFGLKYTQDEWRVFKAFIYAIFESKNKGRQCLYQYDKGYSGKSVLQSVLVNFMGERNIKGLQKDSLSNQFGMAKIWDKRLVMLGDNKNQHIIHTEKIHMLLGGDYSDIEYKGRSSFSAKLSSKMIINGNVTPFIDANAAHERTRLILLKPEITTDVLAKLSAKDEDGNIKYDSFGNPQLLGDPDFEKHLIEEFPMFLYMCKKEYDELCPRHGNIELPTSMVESLYNLGADEESLYDAMIADLFTFRPTLQGPKADILKLYKSHAQNYGLETSNNAYGNFITYVKNKYKITESKIATEIGRVNAYIGMCVTEKDMTTRFSRPPSRPAIEQPSREPIRRVEML